MVYDEMLKLLNDELLNMTSESDLGFLSIEILCECNIDKKIKLISDLINNQINLKKVSKIEKQRLIKIYHKNRISINSVISEDKKYRLINKKIKFLTNLLDEYSKEKEISKNITKKNQSSSENIIETANKSINEIVIEEANYLIGFIPNLDINLDEIAINNIDVTIKNINNNLKIIKNHIVRLKICKKHLLNYNIYNLVKDVDIKYNELKKIESSLNRSKKKLKIIKETQCNLKVNLVKEHEMSELKAIVYEYFDNIFNIEEFLIECNNNNEAKMLSDIVKVQINIDKIKTNIQELIYLYSNFTNINNNYKIDELKYELELLEKIIIKINEWTYQQTKEQNFHKTKIKSTDSVLVNMYNKKIFDIDKYVNLVDPSNKEEIEALKCFICKIKQLYIKNIKLYININSKHEKIEYINCEVKAIEKIINTLDKMLKSFEHKPIKMKKEKIFISKEDNLDFDYFRNIIFNGNSEDLISILGSNPEICLLKNNNCEYLFEEYLNYIKNLIINSNSKMEDLYEFSKKILFLQKIINEYDYLELEDIYNQFINQFLNTVENLEIKNFDKKHLELASKFLKMINIGPCVKRIVDSDKFIEQIYSYHNNMNNIRSDFDYNHIITIDNNEAKLLDTAYSFRKDKQGNYYIGIYIKDMNDLLEKFDLEELYSKFIRNKRMFNHDFSLHNLSLSVSRNYHKVLGHHFVLDRNFKVKSLKIRKEIVAISNNLKYDDVREIITSDRNENLREILKLYHLIGNNIIDCKRKYSLYNNVGIDSLNHNIMIFFNYYMASFCKCNNIPSIFLTDKYYTNKTISDQIPYSKYSCPARNFVSLINQLIYGIYMYNNISVDETTKIVEMLENYATNMNYNSHDSDLKKAKKKHLSN